MMNKLLLAPRHCSKDPNPTGLLHLFLAQLVYHSDFLKQVAADHPGHAFRLLSLVFDNPELLSSLKKNVTIYPSPDMLSATGAPPSQLSFNCNRIFFDIYGEVKEAVHGLESTIKLTTTDTIDKMQNWRDMPT